MKTLKTTNSKKFFSMTCTPKVDYDTNTVWFNFSNRGGTARYSLVEEKFIPCRNEVASRAKDWIIAEYID